MEPLENLRQIRLSKLEKIKKSGIDPYPAKCVREETIKQALKKIGQTVSVAGRLMSFRAHGKITFADLRDESGQIQLLFKADNLTSKEYQFLENLDIGDFISAEGEVFKTNAGEITVDVKQYTLLTKSLLPLPSNWYGLKDVEEKLRKRYLDLLINSEVRDLFKLKSKFWASMRKFMLDHDFLEVETPVLQDIPGGADARPFITHMNALDIDLYLRISLELPLKKLLVGGFEKVFEIGRIFRNEGIDEEHLQDYTQLEFYWAYADYNQLMDFTQKMYQTVIEETFGKLKTTWHEHTIDWSGQWPKVDYTDLLNEHWDVDIDKMSIEDLYALAKKLKVNVEPNLGKGRLLDYLYKKTIRPKLIQPMFVINHPVEVEPLAKRLPENPDKVQRMQVLAMGTELGKGFSELNDPLDQRQRFEEQMKLRAAGDEEAQMMDEDYVEAMEYGMPPNAGLGISERLFAMLIDKPVREMVFFPLMKPEGKNEIESKKITSTTNKSNDRTVHGKGLNKVMNRDKALEIIEENITNKNIIKHMLAVEAVMGALAKKFDPNKADEWKLAGLLHDGDYCDRVPHEMQGIQISKWVEEKGFQLSDEIKHAMAAHNCENTKITPESKMDWALFCCDTLTGLIIACALVTSEKKLADVKVESVLKKFKNPGFAAGTRRQEITMCEEKLGLSLEEFVKIALGAMQGISSDLGL